MRYEAGARATGAPAGLNGAPDGPNGGPAIGGDAAGDVTLGGPSGPAIGGDATGDVTPGGPAAGVRDALAFGDGIDALSPKARALPHAARVRIGIGAALVLVLIGLGVAVAVTIFAPHGGTSTVPPVSASTRVEASSGAAAPAAATSAPVFVHVLGAVRHPGLYQLRSGARVVDAIGAAGGFAPAAEQGGVNLARVLSDGEQVVVPTKGQAAPPGAAAARGTAGASVGGGAGTAASGAKVNLNSATQAELETLPRIGPALAQRIIDWRTKNGRFASIQDLANVTGIGEKTFDGLKELVTV